MIPAAWILWSVAWSLDSCSARSLPSTETLSTWQNTPERSESTLFIWHWKISGALEILNSSLLKQNLPKGVIKVVNNLDSLASGICQNSLLASNLLNIAAPDNCASVVSTLGIRFTSLNTFSFSGVRSIQIRTAPESLRTITIATHQWVGCSTGENTPRLCMHCNSHCTLDHSGRGIFREQMLACLIVYSHENVPNPVNNERYCEMILFPFSTEHTFNQ